MIRIVGILCGSALAVSLLIIILGVPEILPATPAPIESDQRYQEAHNPVQAEVVPAAAVLPAAISVDDIPVEELVVDEPANIQPLIDEAMADAEMVIEIPDRIDPMPEDNWYAFWSPFRSEIAANGFVSQLQRTTGLDYRVVKVKTGVYEVAFAYADNADIETKLATIASATGLELPGG